MPSSDSPALIVARYLKTNNYIESYEALVSEAGLPVDAGTTSTGDLTLEALLDEKKAFDISVKFEKLGVEDASIGWTKPAPATASEVSHLPSASNILSARVERLQGEDGQSEHILFASTADRALHLLNASTLTLYRSLHGLHDAPILSCVALGQNHLLTCSMSGQLYLSDRQGKTISKRSDHSKYVVRIAVLEDAAEGFLVATAGWDNKVLIYRPTSPSGALKLGEPTARISLPTKPEAIAVVRHPTDGHPILLVTRTDSSFVFYYTVAGETPRLLGTQNLAPHSNTWVAFTPSAFEICPTDPSLLAVATSSVPHMRLLIVHLLFPSCSEEVPPPASRPHIPLISLLHDNDDRSGPGTPPQTSPARAALAVAEAEAAAIQIHSNTMAPQTAYSTPAVAWRPDGSGIWVNGDDGIIRGIEASTGRVVSTLRGHEAGTKVRCLWAGTVREGGGGGGDDGGVREQEVVVSGGFDQKLLVWTV